MARTTKKRKAPARHLDEPKAFDRKDGQLGPIHTYEDVADSEDEFYINRDKILLDDEPNAKRRRHWEEEDALLDGSEDEILDYSISGDEVEGDYDEEEEKKALSPSRSKPNAKGQVAPGLDESDEDNDDAGGWGSSKRDYYNADVIETEADAQEEEAEAKRLQQKKLLKMSEADFGFDEDEWLDIEDKEDDRDIVTEVLKDVDITPQMGPEERLRILHTRYPEFEFLADDLLQLQPLLQDLELETESGASPFSLIKHRALSAYVGSLTMYFAILSSTARISNGKISALDPLELRDHAVMESLLKCRELWSKVQGLKTPSTHQSQFKELEDSTSPESEEILDTFSRAQPVSTQKSKKERAREAAAVEAHKARFARIQTAEADIADLSTLLPNSKKVSRKLKSVSRATAEDTDSDFGEETHLDARAAADKAQKKKSLRFYTSQVAQKANRRADAGRDAGGDTDLPYRERLRDRQARLNIEAEKRGKDLDAYGRGAELGGADSGDEDAAVADELRGEEDEYYDMVAQTSAGKKADKKNKYEAIAAAKAANGLVRVVEGDVDKDGKRAIGYVISKNKGLAPKRKKEVRNPRVKKRMKYEEKMKKLSSVRAVYKGGEGRGGYGGEKTGIKTGLVKSIKL